MNKRDKPGAEAKPPGGGPRSKDPPAVAELLDTTGQTELPFDPELEPALDVVNTVESSLPRSARGSASVTARDEVDSAHAARHSARGPGPIAAAPPLASSEGSSKSSREDPAVRQPGHRSKAAPLTVPPVPEDPHRKISSRTLKAGSAPTRGHDQPGVPPRTGEESALGRSSPRPPRAAPPPAAVTGEATRTQPDNPPRSQEPPAPADDSAARRTGPREPKGATPAAPSRSATRDLQKAAADAQAQQPHRQDARTKSDPRLRALQAAKTGHDEPKSKAFARDSTNVAPEPPRSRAEDPTGVSPFPAPPERPLLSEETTGVVPNPLPDARPRLSEETTGVVPNPLPEDRPRPSAPDAVGASHAARAPSAPARVADRSERAERTPHAGASVKGSTLARAETGLIDVPELDDPEEPDLPDPPKDGGSRKPASDPRFADAITGPPTRLPEEASARREQASLPPKVVPPVVPRKPAADPWVEATKGAGGGAYSRPKAGSNLAQNLSALIEIPADRGLSSRLVGGAIVGSILVILFLVRVFSGGPTKPQLAELRQLYPYGFSGATGPRGERAPPANEIDFTFVELVSCAKHGAPECLLYEYSKGGFKGTMVLQKQGNRWLTIGVEGMPFLIGR